MSPVSLFNAPAAEVTAARVRSLVVEHPQESLTVEYKAGPTKRIADSVAAMANSYGGLIIVGVDDTPGPDRIVGVDSAVASQIIDACHDTLEPPWEPETIIVDMGSGITVVVVRVDPARAPRPLLVGGRAPIRLQGRNAVADRARLAQLFTEAPPAGGGGGGWLIQLAQMPVDGNGSPTLDLRVGSGLMIPVGDRAAHRPMSERSVQRLVDALNGSPLAERLLEWSSHLRLSDFAPFRREGFNRARRAQLRWNVVSATADAPVAASAAVELPQPLGAVSTTMSFTVDVSLAVRSSLPYPQLAQGVWRLSPLDLDAIIEAVTATLVDDAVVAALADLAAVEKFLIPQPANVNVQTGPDVADLLYLDRLRRIPDAGSSRGGMLLADPALDLRDLAERAEQLDAWMVQIALDAGLSGMEHLVSELRRAQQRPAPGRG